MPTKILLIIVRGDSCSLLLDGLADAGYHVTEFSSIGTFFRHKSTTLIIGLPADQVEPALTTIRNACPTPPDADEHNVTLFVLDAGQFVYF
jgi:uncharacterized protein YaaQ